MNGQRKIAIALTDSDAQSVHRMIQELGLALTSDGTQTVFFNSFNRSEWAGLAAQGINTVLCYGGGIGHATQCVDLICGMTVILTSLDHPAYWIDACTEFRNIHLGRTVFTFPTQSNLAFAGHFLADADIRCWHHSSSSTAPEPIPVDQRNGSIVFIGNYSPSAEIAAAVACQAPTLVHAFNGAIKHLNTTADSSLETAVARYFQAPYAADRQPFIWLCIMVDRHMRATTRLQALMALQGHPVTLIGRGWDGVPLHPATTYLGPQDSTHALKHIANSRIVVNTTPAYYDSHERMFDAAAHGAVIVTARNWYTTKLFADCGVLYDAPAEIGDLCAQLLADPDQMAAKGRAGRQLIHRSEGWPHRVGELTAMLNDGTTPDYDTIVDLKIEHQPLNLSVARLQATANLLIAINPDQVQSALNLVAQLRQYLRPQAGMTIAVHGTIPSDALIPVANLLTVNGFCVGSIRHSPAWSSISFQQSAGS